MMVISILSFILNFATVVLLLSSMARQRAMEDELLSIKNILYRKRTTQPIGQTVTPFRSRIEGTDAS